MLHLYRSTFGFSVGVLLLLSTSNVLAEDCVHGVRYVRKDRSYIHVGPTVESENGPATARVEMQALGNIAPDGVPRYGNLEGEIYFTRDNCAGVISNPEYHCSLIVIFTTKAAKVYEVGNCFTGTGVYGAGLYAKEKVRK